MFQNNIRWALKRAICTNGILSVAGLEIDCNDSFKSTPQKRRPTGIHSSTLSLQHLHLWPAIHRLQKAYICWRPSNHACWCSLEGSERGAYQGHGNNRLVTPDLEAKAQHYKNGVGRLPPQQQGNQTWAKIQP